MDESNRPSRRWPLTAIGAFFFMAGLVIAAWNVELPYVAFSSGPVADAADVVVAESVDTYPPSGSLLMLTIVSQEVNVIEAMVAAFDPHIDLVRIEALRSPDETEEDYRLRNLSLMDDSVRAAITAALDWLGYEMVPQEILIIEVSPEVPASDLLEPGDRILAVDGADVVRSTDLTALVDSKSPGDTVTITVSREGVVTMVDVELVARQDEPDRPMIGIAIREITEPPFPIDIESGNIGGPSAGMMYTLAILDYLTPGELTGGEVVAGTGTITADGSVGAIGGVRQKVVGAAAAGAKYVLVPESNYAEALTAGVDGVEIVAIASLDDALDFLERLVSG